ncbi:MAG: putative toxin-antitoxin system toxin component, PIN family [Leptospiraceae bacterium]|nr:putative toxin-antitoxin system toxin component, PIN family [Leptospiraceae bacterium]
MYLVRVSIDTNVIYQALRDTSGASNFIVRLVRQRKLELALSIPVFSEYSDVLLREKSLQDLELTKKDIKDFLDYIISVASPFSISFRLRPNLSDEADNIFVELAFTSNSKFLITSNIRDYTIGNNLIFDSFKTITPTDFVRMWRKFYV